MLDLIIRKVLWILGTLFLVSIIFFFLNKNIPGDRVESILNYRGLTMMGHDFDYYQKEYNKLAKEIGEDLPQFYFSITPSFKKSAPFTNQSSRINAYCQDLSNQKYPHQPLSDFAESLVELESYSIQYKIKESQSYFRSLFAEKGLDNWAIILESWQSETYDDTVMDLVQHVKEHVIELNKSRVSFYFPIITWNGLENQYHGWLSGFFKNNLGVSMIDGQDVTSKIWTALQWTLLLVLISLIISFGISVLLSLLLMKYRNGVLCQVIMSILSGVFAIPIFWLATIFIVFFTTVEYGAWTDWFPSPIPQIISGDENVLVLFIGRIKYLILPIICIVLKEIPVFTKLIYVGLDGESQKPYATSLRGKGIKESALVFRHLLPNSLIPIITMVGNYLPGSLAGSLIIEIIFNVPGMGRLLFFSLFNRDYEVCFGVLFIITLVTILVLALSDVLYKWVNPKIKIAS